MFGKRHPAAIGFAPLCPGPASGFGERGPWRADQPQACAPQLRPERAARLGRFVRAQRRHVPHGQKYRGARVHAGRNLSGEFLCGIAPGACACLSVRVGRGRHLRCAGGDHVAAARSGYKHQDETTKNSAGRPHPSARPLERRESIAHRGEAFSRRLSAVSYQRSAFGSQLPAISRPLSAFGPQLSSIFFLLTADN